MPLYRDEAVVLRVHKLGEADRIVTLLTRRHGRIRAVGKGVRRTTSRYGARLEPGSHIDVQLHTRTAEPDAERGHPRSPGLDLVTQVESVDNYGARLAGDYPAWTAAVAICETAERLTAEEGEPALRQYLLVVGALRSLADREHEAVADPGRLPDPVDVAGRLGTGAGRVRGVLGARPARAPSTCRPAARSARTAARPARPARSRSRWTLMAALLSGDWAARRRRRRADLRREASGLIAAHLQWHLERGIRSLPLVDR